MTLMIDLPDNFLDSLAEKIENEQRTPKYDCLIQTFCVKDPDDLTSHSDDRGGISLSRDMGIRYSKYLDKRSIKFDKSLSLMDKMLITMYDLGGKKMGNWMKKGNNVSECLNLNNTQNTIVGLEMSFLEPMKIRQLFCDLADIPSEALKEQTSIKGNYLVCDCDKYVPRLAFDSKDLNCLAVCTYERKKDVLVMKQTLIS